MSEPIEFTIQPAEDDGKNIVVISDFSYREIPGGAESNDEILMKALDERGYDGVSWCSTKHFNENHLELHPDENLYIISNFYFISPEAKAFLSNKKYIIIEHDYKFLATRNPAEYEDCVVPKDKIIHEEFYKGAAKVLTQSRLQLDIFNKNLTLDNIKSFSGNLWTEESLDYIEQLSSKKKNGKAAILDEDFWIKGKAQAIQFCQRHQIEYDLITKQEYFSFLDSLSNYSLYVFFPQTPETLSRVTLEAKMMNLAVITNEFTGAYHEDFYSSSGKELIKKMWVKREEIVDIIEKEL